MAGHPGNIIVSGFSQTQQYITLFYLDVNMFQSLNNHQATFTKLRKRYMECTASTLLKKSKNKTSSYNTQHKPIALCRDWGTCSLRHTEPAIDTSILHYFITPEKLVVLSPPRFPCSNLGPT
jgi:hypothetical protein